MIVYRVAKKIYIEDLRGEGARLFGGRWNKENYSMLYTSTHLSLSVLELLVHVDYKFITNDFYYIVLELPENTKISNVHHSILKENWRENPPNYTTKNYGTNWLLNNKNLALQVPSAVLPKEYNILLNPLHINFKDIKILEKGKLELDARITN